MAGQPNDADRTTSLGTVLAVTALCSLGTGVFWHGVPFIAKHTYEFSQTRNLVLYAAMGVVYTIGAFRAGALTRWVEHWLSPRGVLMAAVGIQGILCVLPVLFPGQWALWVAAVGGTFLASIIWPVVESYLTAGRHGPSMRRAIGWFNFTWALAVAVPLFLMAPILELHGEWGKPLRHPSASFARASDHQSRFLPFCAHVVLPCGLLLVKP